jgi:hypothetical protein
VRAKTLAAACVSIAAVVLVVAAAAAVVVRDPAISSNEPLPFPQDAENEPTLALDRNTMRKGPLLIAGGNDYHDQTTCKDSTKCSFTEGVGISGVYFSGGGTWHAASYSGNVAPTGTVTSGTIRTLPNFTKRQWSFGDPGLAAGPVPGSGGEPFAWKNGTRIYYVTLAATSLDSRSIVVSRAENDVPDAIPQAAWKAPVSISGQTPSPDKPAIWVDNAAGSQRFGTVYACWTTSVGDAAGRIAFSRSKDGGTTWTPPILVSSSEGAHGCTIRTDGGGRVYVFWEWRRQTLGDAKLGTACRGLFKAAIQMARSPDGVQFSGPVNIASVHEAGRYDPRQKRCTVDGAAGARTNTLPSVDIASGAPAGHGPDTIAVAWNDGPAPVERVLVKTSHNRGATWSRPLDVTRATVAPGATVRDRPAFPAVALSPSGTYLYVVYNAFLQGWQKTTSTARFMQGVMRVAALSALEANPAAAKWGEVRGADGDVRGSSGFSEGNKDKQGERPGVEAEFLGDYSAVAATNAVAYGAWTDASAAVPCDAVDSYRQKIIKGGSPTFGNLSKLCTKTPVPGVATKRFGNTTLCGGSITPSSIGKAPKTLRVCERDPHPS